MCVVRVTRVKFVARVSVFNVAGVSVCDLRVAKIKPGPGEGVIDFGPEIHKAMRQAVLTFWPSTHLALDLCYVCSFCAVVVVLL